MISALRLRAAGVIEGETRRTVPATAAVRLEWHDHGVMVVRGDAITLVPWGSIDSVQYTQEAPKQLKPTQPSPEPSSADPRPVRAPKRARAKARDTSRS